MSTARTYAKHRSHVTAGNRHQDGGGKFLKTGGEQRARFTTTLPPSALQALDRLVTEAEQQNGEPLQRNEALVLLLATVMHRSYGLPEAQQRFLELAAAWKGWGSGVQPPANAKPPTQRRHGGGQAPKLGPDALQSIRENLALGDAAPRGWRAALARANGVTAGAITKAAKRLRAAA